MGKEKKDEGKRKLVRAEPSIFPATIDEIERKIESYVDEAFRRPFSFFGRPRWPGFPRAEATTPTVDIFREGSDVVVKAELPGMKKEDIDVTISGDLITVSGEKKKEEKVKEKDYYRYERSEGSFTRSLRLPEDIQPDKAKAAFNNGVLEIKIPMTEEAKKKEKKLKIE